MKQTLNCYVTAILFLFSTSITCAQTTTTGGAGAGGEGADPLKVELFATPQTQIVGYQVDLTAEASGGKPKYIYGFSMTCDIAGLQPSKEMFGKQQRHLMRTLIFPNQAN